MAGNTWLLTWTTYGTWLPGDERGFVGYVREKLPDDAKPADWRPRLELDTPPDDALRADDARRRVISNTSPRVIHNVPGTPYDGSIPVLKRYAESQMKGVPVWLNHAHAEVFLAECRRTATFRHWQLLAVAVIANHVHLVVAVAVDLPGERLLQEFKSYGSRMLNREFGKPSSGTWWTKSGSTRLLPNDRAVHAAVEYVRNQHRPLVVWIAGEDPSIGVEEQHPSTGVDGSMTIDDDTRRADDALRADDASRRVHDHDQPGRKKKDDGE
jgi:REP element-mobilizing transposase RayT